MQRSTAFALVLGLIAACSDTSIEGSPLAEEPPTPTSSISVSSFSPSGDPEADLAALIDGSAELKELVAAREDWQDADAAVSEYLADAAPAMKGALSEVAAVLMLEERLLEGDASRQKREAIARYRDLLTDAGHTDSELLGRAAEYLAR